MVGKSFREYYALKAAMSFGLGSQDEWNVARQIDGKRRADSNYGISKELGVSFDECTVSPAEVESKVTHGDARACSAAQ